MTISEAKNYLSEQLIQIYEEREARKMTEIVMEKLTGLDRVQALLRKNESLNSEQISLLGQWQKELLSQRPIQYVLGEAWFMNFTFYVQEGVLIPRPETAELVQWILDIKGGEYGNVLDIGTGSGCIAISLAKLNPKFEVWGIDISSLALTIAERNNRVLDAPVQFKQMDILADTYENWEQKLDIIVSNPPYIQMLERKDMSANVLDFEPETALFVPDEDPLLFYRTIAAFACKTLKPDGYLFFEINESFGKEVVDLLVILGFTDIQLRGDLQGKDRMVKALWHVN